ncbi:MAG: hypothetical protein ABIN89_01740 [Chitinophagaceae bacterium]
MKRIVAISFLFIHLMAITELCQVLKIPLLVSHYKEHHTLNGDITFFMFLRMHYFNGDPRDSDYDSDMELPFKTNSYAITANVSFSLPACIQNVAPLVSSQDLPVNYPKFFSVWMPSVPLNDIFQPPRVS